MEFNLFAQIILFSFIGGVLSLVGGVFLLINPNFTQRIIIHLITFAAGTLLTVALFDILPECIEEIGSVEAASPWVLAGVLFFFVIELFLRRHHAQNHISESKNAPHSHNRASTPLLISIGDFIHNFVDGVAITAGFLISPATGMVTALAIAAHEVPQEISDFSILLKAGWSRGKVLWWNLVVALATTLGAIVAYVFRGSVEPFLGPILAFTVGIFIYIAASDIIPEIHAQSHNHEKPIHILHVIIALLAGVFITVGVLSLTHSDNLAAHSVSLFASQLLAIT